MTQLQRLNREEQVQVVIRMRPMPSDQHSQSRAVFLAPNQKSMLAVEAQGKKDYFVFDDIADETVSQEGLYNMVGPELIRSCFQGFNCCIFAYGQTGAGKTYSILGDVEMLSRNIYSQSMGIIPRVFANLFKTLKEQADSYTVRCIYFQIYNQQVFDLLSDSDKPFNLRQDAKRGVFIENMEEHLIEDYPAAMEVLMRGINKRRTASTSMNELSSRAHTILTVNVDSMTTEGQKVIARRSKLNIVDLAGSERLKQTKAEGDRMKEGCKINNSLLVLGNVINALVESSKKKKHVPFRDSKLTLYLKDSLCGNSSTKLLANVHCSTRYISDTLSTLKLAKRAKSLKLQVEAHENRMESFQSMRQEIKTLREELAQAKYIRVETQPVKTAVPLSESSFNRVPETDFDGSSSDYRLQLFEENERVYKSLIVVYEEHMKSCIKAGALHKHQQWRNLQKKYETMTKLSRHIPAFTKIFRENMTLKKQLRQFPDLGTRQHTYTELALSVPSTPRDLSERTANVPANLLIRVVSEYETLIDQLRDSFMVQLQTVEQQYSELESKIHVKDEIIRELNRKRQLPPDVQQLLEENQILKLNILELENEIKEYEQNQVKLNIELREERKTFRRGEQSQEGNITKQIINARAQAQQTLVLPPIPVFTLEGLTMQPEMAMTLLNSLESLQKDLSSQAAAYQEQRVINEQTFNQMQAQLTQLFREKSLLEQVLGETHKDVRMLNESLGRGSSAGATQNEELPGFLVAAELDLQSDDPVGTKSLLRRISLTEPKTETSQ